MLCVLVLAEVGSGRWDTGTALLCPAQEWGHSLGGSRACPGHTAEHVFPAEWKSWVLCSCRVTLQSAGHGCAGGSHGSIASPFLAVIPTFGFGCSLNAWREQGVFRAG